MAAGLGTLRTDRTGDGDRGEDGDERHARDDPCGVARLRGPYHGSQVRRDFGAVRDEIGSVSASCRCRSRPIRLGPLDLRARSRPCRAGRGDPTIRLAPDAPGGRPGRADGPATLALGHVGAELRAEALGPWRRTGARGRAGAARSRRAPAADPGRPPARADLARRAPGVRIPRTGAVLESLVPAILEQKVTGQEAQRALARSYPCPRRTGARAPEWRLRLGPPPATLAALPYFAYHPFGVERRRAEVIRRVAARAAWFEAIVDLPLAEAYARLTAVPGIGPWTAAEVGVRALGDPDAVSVGDFHLPNLVAFALAGEPRGTDARMLELLEPYRGQRARVVRLLELSGIRRATLRPAPDRPGSRTI